MGFRFRSDYSRLPLAADWSPRYFPRLWTPIFRRPSRTRTYEDQHNQRQHGGDKRNQKVSGANWIAIWELGAAGLRRRDQLYNRLPK